MKRRLGFAALLAIVATLGSAGPAVLAQQPPAGAGLVQHDQWTRDESSRLAVAVLGQVCLIGLGDPGAPMTIAAPGGEFGFIEAPADVASSFLDGREGVVRVLRRPKLGAVVLVAGKDGICSVFSELADADALRRHLFTMVERGGLKGGGQLLSLSNHDADGQRVSEYFLLPKDWYASQLGKRFVDDGKKQILLTTSVSLPGSRPMEAVLSVARAK
jgi:hypothetical protein